MNSCLKALPVRIFTYPKIWVGYKQEDGPNVGVHTGAGIRKIVLDIGIVSVL